MKKIIKIIFLVFSLLIFLYTIFMVEESIRISHNLDAKPLIILKKETNYERITYYSVGFRLTNKYGYSQLDYEKENRIIIGQDLWLFGKFLIWGWIS